MRSDLDIKRDVEAELQSNPDIDATDIAVAVRNGVVTLTGYVRSYAQKWEAEQTAKRVAGVVGVANDIEVRLPISPVRAVIARSAATIAVGTRITGRPRQRTVLGKALQRLQPEVRDLEPRPDPPPRALGNDDRVGLGQRLQPRGEVGVLPMIAYSCAEPAPIRSPTTTSPVAMPIRTLQAMRRQ
jgi:hypothetical protein